MMRSCSRNSMRLFYCKRRSSPRSTFFFLNDTPPTEITTLPLHDALPIGHRHGRGESDECFGELHGGRREEVISLCDSLRTWRLCAQRRQVRKESQRMPIHFFAAADSF